MYKHVSFKGSPTSLISSVIFQFGGSKLFFERLSGDGTEFWDPVTTWALPIGGMECSLYGFGLSNEKRKQKSLLDFYT